MYLCLISYTLLVFNTAAFAQNHSTTRPEPNERYQSLETLAQGLYYLETLYVDPKKVKQGDLVENALNGIVKKLDPHTSLMPSQAFEQLTIDTKGKFGGVGIMISHERGKLIVINPIEDTPAERAGIKAGDEIVTIDGKKVSKMKREVAAEAMRGPPNSSIVLQVKRSGQSKLIEFTLKREVIKIKSVQSNNLGHDILYSRIASFQDETTTEMLKSLQKYKKKHKEIKGLILDLRNNPGGLLEQAVQISDLFIESGVIVSTVGRNNDDVEREFAHKRGSWTSFPIIVLINAGSASASEIVAGALQDHKRALVMGQTSFGKGSVQTLVSLPNKAGLKITVARYYTPNDRSIQAKGIKPDVIVYSSKMTIPSAKKKKEADLKRHIIGTDLSNLAKSSGLLTQTKNWPQFQRNDNQLITAYTYLRGWSLFRNIQ